LFVVTCSLIVYIWWPLAQELLRIIDWEGEWWRYMDWLLFGIFGFMSLMIMAGADLRRDGLIVFVGACGGLVIESWGTQTHIWNYYTLERPPLWIIPAWPIANLTIDRIVRLLNEVVPQQSRTFKVIYWPVFAGFMALMLIFVAPTLTQSMTLAALWLCLTLILTPRDHRLTLMHFTAGAGLGYFLELWGTTRQCWTYYTLETPPLFAVLAHGMAAVAFWRTGELTLMVLGRLRVLIRKPAESPSFP
jgi:hypothetical protein